MLRSPSSFVRPFVIRIWVSPTWQYTQQCSHPLNGLIDCSKGMSGESLREMMDFACSAVTVVASGGSSSAVSLVQPSSTGCARRDSKRPSGLDRSPRLLRRFDGGSMLYKYTGPRQPNSSAPLYAE